MRILLDVSAVPEQPVGAGHYTLALASRLARADDVDLHLACRRRDTSRWVDLAPGATLHAEAPDRRPLRLAWEQTRAAGLASRVDVECWHGPHYTVPLRSPVPSVVTVHDLTFFDHPEWHERSKVRFFRRMIRAATARAAVVLAVSHHTASRLEAVVGSRAPVVVAPHGVDRSRFATEGDVDDDLARLAPYGVTPPYVAFAGTIEPRKDVPTLVRAFARLAPTHPDLRLVLAGGDGWGAQAARAAIERSGVASRVLRPGYVGGDAIPALFRRAAVVAYPSLEEGFGLPALEAMACGAPLVTTTGSAIEEVVGDAALLVAPGDVDGLAAALGRALDPTTAARLRAAGPPRAATFTWEASVEAHLDAYRIAVAAGAETAR